MRRDTARIYGPYRHGDQWRLHIVRTRGGKRETAYDVYPSRELAEAALTGARDVTQGRTVRQAVDAYLDKLRSKEREPATIESAEDRLTVLLGLPGNDHRPLRWLNTRGAELYTAAQVKPNGKHRAADTHRNALNVGKTWAAFCVKQRWLRSNPFEDVEPVGRKVLGAEKPQLNVDEARKLRAYCHAHTEDVGAVLSLAYLLLGSRASEIVRRDVRDLDDGGRLLWIGKTKSKAGRRRLIVPDELRPLLLALCTDRPPTAPLFVNADGGKATRFTARDHVRRICKLAGVQVLPPQALRRTQGTLATEAGVAALAVSAHLGHASTAITARAYVNPEATATARTERAFRVLDGGLAG
jgi:integrase